MILFDLILSKNGAIIYETLFDVHLVLDLSPSETDC